MHSAAHGHSSFAEPQAGYHLSQKADTATERGTPEVAQGYSLRASEEAGKQTLVPDGTLAEVVRQPPGPTQATSGSRLEQTGRLAQQLSLRCRSLRLTAAELQ